MGHFSFEQDVPVIEIYNKLLEKHNDRFEVSKALRVISVNFVRPGDVLYKFDNEYAPPEIGDLLEVKRESKIVKAGDFGFVQYQEIKGEAGLRIDLCPFIHVAKDNMKAIMFMPDLSLIKRHFTLTDILSEIDRRGFRSNLDRTAIRENFETAKKNEGSVFTFVTGTQPKLTSPPQVKLNNGTTYITRSSIGCDTKDLFKFDVNKPPLVAEGTVIGVMQPPAPGVDGADVYGKDILAKMKEPDFKLGTSVQLAEDKYNVQTMARGLLVVNDREISISPVKEVPGTVTARTAPLVANESIIVNGDVEEGTEVTSKKGAVIVLGNVTGANVSGMAGVFVKGAITGKQGTKISSSGNVTAGSIRSATVLANGCVVAQTLIANSYIKTNGHVFVTADTGALYGGKTFSCLGVVASTIGEAANPTEITFGIVKDFKKKLADFSMKETDNKQVLRKFLTQLGPNFLKNPKQYLANVPAQQKEKVALLLQEYRNIVKEQQILTRWITRIKEYITMADTAKVQAKKEINPDTTFVMRECSKTIDTLQSAIELRFDLKERVFITKKMK